MEERPTTTTGGGSRVPIEGSDRASVKQEVDDQEGTC